MKKLLVIIVLLCVAISVPVYLIMKERGEQLRKDIEILDCGVSSDEDGNVSYAAVFRNNTDKFIRKALFEVEAFDENGEKLKPLTDDAVYLMTEGVRPGETSACAAMFKKDHLDDYGGTMPFDEVPAKVTFKAAAYTEFEEEKDDSVKLKLVDFEPCDPGYRVEDMIAFKVRILNEGREDFAYDFHNGETNTYMRGTIVYKDADGNVIGGAELGCCSTDHQSEEPLVFKAGEETEAEMSEQYCSWQSEDQDIYLQACYED